MCEFKKSEASTLADQRKRWQQFNGTTNGT
ncbi:uncharacterized protein METZ01_LOCUS506877 [marine metagenome]|uniref:Uncharacterized protein n=1 Tax=marine metagenome TaxID=408172 RepID=A0A383EC97_9ZZZZ